VIRYNFTCGLVGTYTPAMHTIATAPSTMLRMVPLPRFAGEDRGRSSSAKRGRGTAEGGEGGAHADPAKPFHYALVVDHA
jgi:hypothetical protein